MQKLYFCILFCRAIHNPLWINPYANWSDEEPSAVTFTEYANNNPANGSFGSYCCAAMMFYNWLDYLKDYI